MTYFGNSVTKIYTTQEDYNPVHICVKSLCISTGWPILYGVNSIRLHMLRYYSIYLSQSLCFYNTKIILKIIRWSMHRQLVKIKKCNYKKAHLNITSQVLVLCRYYIEMAKTNSRTIWVVFNTHLNFRNANSIVRWKTLPRGGILVSCGSLRY